MFNKNPPKINWKYHFKETILIKSEMKKTLMNPKTSGSFETKFAKNNSQKMIKLLN